MRRARYPPFCRDSRKAFPQEQNGIARDPPESSLHMAESEAVADGNPKVEHIGKQAGR
ncbi:hypothetical protein GCM10023067_54230 [Aminobacter aganoensis]